MGLELKIRRRSPKIEPSSSIDDFEKIDYPNDSTDLAGNPNTKDPEETEKREKTVDEVVVQSNSDEIVGQLSRNTRNEIVLILFDYSQLLFSNLITDTEKKELTDGNFKLYQTLANLPPKGSSTSIGNAKQTVFDLDFDLKSKIINSLLKNHNLAIVCAQSASPKRKSKLVKENSLLIDSLRKLSANVVEKAADESGSVKDAADGNVPALSKERALSPCKSENENGQFVKRTEMSDQVEMLSKQIRDLTSIIDGFQSTIQRLDNNRPEVSFTCEFDKIPAFLCDTNDTALRSDIFYCRGKQFYVVLFKTLADCKVLDLQVHLNLVCDDVVNWWIDLSSEICLLNQLPSEKNHVTSNTKKRIVCEVDDDQPIKMVICALISPSNLINSGFLKDGKLTVQIHLKAEKLNRDDF